MKIPKRSLQKRWGQVMFIPGEKLQTSGGCGQSGKEQRGAPGEVISREKIQNLA